MLIVRRMKIFDLSVPDLPSAEACQKARDLFDASVPSIPTEDMSLDQFVDEMIEIKTAQLEAFRMFAHAHDLPEMADYATWSTLFRKNWRDMERRVVLPEEIFEYVGRSGAKA